MVLLNSSVDISVDSSVTIVDSYGDSVDSSVWTVDGVEGQFISGLTSINILIKDSECMWNMTG